MKRNNFEEYNTEYKLSKDWIVPFSQIKKDCALLLYGAGDVGQAYYYQLKITNYCCICAWVDKKAEEYQKIGLEVVNPEKIDKYNYDYVLIATADSTQAREINSFLLSKGVQQEKIVWNGFSRQRLVNNLLDYYLHTPIYEEMKKVLNYRGINNNSYSAYNYCSGVTKIMENGGLVIPRVVLQVTERCTLKCKGCNNLMPLYKKPQNYSVEKVISDFKKFVKQVDKILILELLGGEPLVYPELSRIIKEIAKSSCADIVELTTNGTIIPSDELMESLSLVESCVRISKYSKSNKINLIIEKCVKYGVNYEVMEDLTWLDSQSVENRGYTKEELKMTYSKCPSNRICKTIANGKIFCCARAASLYELGICKDESIYLNLSDANKNSIREFYTRGEADACNYCTCTDEWRVIAPGEQ